MCPKNLSLQNQNKRLVTTAKKMGKLRLAMIIMTICATGIRVSELSALTVTGVKRGVIHVDNKGKTQWNYSRKPELYSKA